MPSLGKSSCLGELSGSMGKSVVGFGQAARESSWVLRKHCMRRSQVEHQRGWPGRTIIILFLMTIAAQSQEPSTAFEFVSNFRARGSITACAVTQSDTIYLAFTYPDVFELVEVSQAQTRVFAPRTKGSSIAHSLIVSSDNIVYLGTAPQGELFSYDPKGRVLQSLGRPCPTETYLWSLVEGSDGRIYGGTFPGARLFCYDPRTKTSRDLGRMDPDEPYARFVAADSKGYVYVGTGPGHANITAYRIADGHSLQLFHSKHEPSGFPSLFAMANQVYYSSEDNKTYALNGFDAQELAQPITKPVTSLSDGTSIEIRENEIILKHPNGSVGPLQLNYEGHSLNLVRLFAENSQSALFATTSRPVYLVKFFDGPTTVPDPQSVALLSDGQMYGMTITSSGRLLLAGYSNRGPLISIDLTRDHADRNSIYPPLVKSSWRPFGITLVNPGLAYIGAMGGYGEKRGALVSWDLFSNKTLSWMPVGDQSVLALTAKDGIVIGGTSRAGASFVSKSESDARVFAWDTRTHRLVWEVPLPGASDIGNLIFLNNVIVGTADRKLFLLDLNPPKIRFLTDLPGAPLYNTLISDGRGKIWGLGKLFIFSFDISHLKLERVIPSPVSITGGIAIHHDFLYFAAGTDLYRYPLGPSPEIQGFRGPIEHLLTTWHWHGPPQVYKWLKVNRRHNPLVFKNHHFQVSERPGGSGLL